MDIKKYRDLLKETKKKIKEAVNEDDFISHSIKTIDDIEKIINTLSKRLKEWYSLYNPEFSSDNYYETIQKNPKKIADSMGANLQKKDLDIILKFASKISLLYDFKENIENYLSDLMEKYCKNLKTLATVNIAARLIEHTGSLRKLAMLPASTIQILGAEKALFRHLRTGARPPRHGYIINHPLIANATQKEHGKKARALADKICLAVRTDFFKGKYIGDKLKKELEEKFK